MIEVMDAVKAAYKADDNKKHLFAVFRDAGLVKFGHEIASETLRITESICSSGSFKVGLCESATCQLSVDLKENVKGDEMSLFQVLGDFRPVLVDDASSWSGAGVTINDGAATLLARKSISAVDAPIAENGEVVKYGDAEFDPEKYYLVMARARYIGKEIYFYLKSSNGTARMIYYLPAGAKGMQGVKDYKSGTTYSIGQSMRYDGRIWRALDSTNKSPDDDPAPWTDVSPYIQIAIPIIGRAMSEYLAAVYTLYECYSVATMYEIAYPVMPLGLFEIQSCKRNNDNTIRDLQGYDRMQSAKLSNDVHYGFESGLSVTIGEVLNEAAETTQIVIGANLSRVSVEVEEVESSESEAAFPSGNIYGANLPAETTTIYGLYDANGTGYFKNTGETVNEEFDYSSWNFYWPDVPSDWTFLKQVNEGDQMYEYNAETDQLVALWDYDPDLDIYEPRINPPSYGVTISNNYRLYKHTTEYGYDWPDMTGWTLVREYSNGYAWNDRMYRDYERIPVAYWQETATKTRIKYKIQDYGSDPNASYTVYVHPPAEWVYPGEDEIKVEAESYGELSTDRQSEVRDAILSASTTGAVAISASGEFEIEYISQISYSGYTSGAKQFQNPYYGAEYQTSKEKFNDYQITPLDLQLHTTRRMVVASYLELSGLFIHFDRYGVSSFLTISSSSLYPAEDIFPHDPGGEYGALYPSAGADETLTGSYAQNLWVDDKINSPFDGIEIRSSSSNTEDDGTSLYPFYYNRMDKKRGIVDPSMPNVGYWEGNNYYVISDNFFFNYFKFTEDQLKAICQNLVESIGDLQYFNMTAAIKGLPYMEAGDSINIRTLENGYETAVLRRTMSGCMAMMDNIETDFYGD